ncbi:hypothetical protein CKJ62_01475 [Mycobacterium avium]|nr:hypothetical protein CKJ62_01475 [Mycobacterium avium]
MVVSPQRLTRWPSYVRDRHAAITYTTPRDAPRHAEGARLQRGRRRPSHPTAELQRTDIPTGRGNCNAAEQTAARPPVAG